MTHSFQATVTFGCDCFIKCRVRNKAGHKTRTCSWDALPWYELRVWLILTNWLLTHTSQDEHTAWERLQVINTPASEQERLELLMWWRWRDWQLKEGAKQSSPQNQTLFFFTYVTLHYRDHTGYENAHPHTSMGPWPHPAQRGNTSCLAPVGLPTVGDRKWPCFLHRTWFVQSRTASQTASKPDVVQPHTSNHNISIYIPVRLKGTSPSFRINFCV